MTILFGAYQWRNHCLQRFAREARNGFWRAENRLAERMGLQKFWVKSSWTRSSGLSCVMRISSRITDFSRAISSSANFGLENQSGEHVESLRKMLVENARIEADHFLGGERVEHAADAVHFARDVFGGAARRAFEDHVLDEMRDAVQLGRFAARAGAHPDAHRDGMHVLHRLGDDHEPIRQDLFLNSPILR